jgi:hypothetical protein
MSLGYTQKETMKALPSILKRRLAKRLKKWLARRLRKPLNSADVPADAEPVAGFELASPGGRNGGRGRIRGGRNMVG